MTPESKAGTQAWVEAYHYTQSTKSVESLTLKSGALQGVIVVDNPLNRRFESLHISYDGINGQLPNLDLFNTAVAIASGQMGIGVSLQRMWKHEDSYRERLKTMLKGMASQGLGHASGPHSSFIPYHVDAITLKAVGDGWQDEMAMGRCIESTFRSLNNLLEHFHQSFFFYLLMHANRFVSIGTYLPCSMLIAANFSIMAISLWVQSGRPASKDGSSSEKSTMKLSTQVEVVKHDGMVALVPQEDLMVVERRLFLPLASVLVLHFLGFVPLYLFNNTSKTVSGDLIASILVVRFQQSLITMIAFFQPSRYFYLYKHSPPILSFEPPFIIHSPNQPTTAPDKMLLPSASRHVSCYTCNAQFLPGLPNRHPLLSAIIPWRPIFTNDSRSKGWNAILQPCCQGDKSYRRCYLTYLLSTGSFSCGVLFARH